MNKVLTESLTKEYGDIFFDVSKVFEDSDRIIPSTLSLDIALGGGIQEGTIAILAGVSGSGKTTLALTIAAQAQKALGKKIVYLDVENRLQESLLTSIKGLDLSPDKFIYFHSTADRILTTEDFLNILIQVLSLEEDCFIILDSIAALAAENVFGGKIGESKQMVTGPRLMYEMLRKACQLVRPRRHNLIGITHTQANPTPYGGPNEVGGNAWKYLASYRMTCLSTSEVPKDGDEKTGRESTFKIYKNALGPGTGSATFFIKHKAGYDFLTDLFTKAEELGLIAKAGAWYSADLPSGKVKLQGTEKFKTHLAENEKDAKALEKAVRELAIPEKKQK